MFASDFFILGIYYYSFKDYDSYLNFKFGNYMELPPAEERKVHPVSRFMIKGQAKIVK